MSILNDVYELLISQKISDGTYWHVYDIDGNELSDPAGVLWRGNMGALLMWPRAATTTARRSKRKSNVQADFGFPLQTQILQEDELATDLIIALVTKGFFDVDA